MHRRWRFVVAGLAVLLATSVMAPTPVRAQETTLNLNTATREQLLAFPGIGQAYADKIIAARPFKMRSELVGRHIMPAAAYLKIKKRLVPTAEDAAVEKAMDSAPTGPPAPAFDAEGRLNLNVATRNQLLGIPGIGAAYADKIIKGRPFKQLDELVRRRIMSQAAYDEIKSKVFVR
jgi:competence protein ComEA